MLLLCLQVCGACHARLPANPTKLCPLARCGFDQPPRRNLTTEGIIAAGGVAVDCNVAVDCDNAEHGCLETGVGQEVEEHLPECPYREVPCPDTACQARVRLHQLKDHLDTRHTAFTRRDFFRLAKFDGERNVDWFLAPREKNGVIFYLQLVVREGTFFAWVTVVDGGKEAARWTCDVSAGNTATRNQQVHPIDRTVEEVLDSGEYLSLTGQQARRLARPHWVGGDDYASVDYAITEK